MITKFQELKHYGSVGIAFWYNDKILLVKPTTGKRIFDGWSYPKGHYEEGESFNQTAIREVNEELNINLPPNFLDNTEIKELPPVYKLKGIKHYWYYTYNLSPEEFNKYFNNSLTIPKQNLQLDEVTEARFMDRQEAKKIISKVFLGIL